MFLRKIMVACGAALVLSGSVYADQYDKKEGAANKLAGTTQLQVCMLEATQMTCGSASPMSTSYTSGTARSTLETGLGCTYKYSRATGSALGFDVYSCTSGQLAGFTFFVKVDGDLSNSNAVLIVGIMNN